MSSPCSPVVANIYMEYFEDLNRNIGKMFIPHCVDPLISVKPKHPWVDHLSKLPGPVDELAPHKFQA